MSWQKRGSKVTFYGFDFPPCSKQRFAITIDDRRGFDGLESLVGGFFGVKKAAIKIPILRRYLEPS